MDDIKDILTSITRGCSQAGVQVPDVLAAFVARTIVESNASVFALDRKVTPERIEEVILQSIEKLLEKDSPSLEMMKMQVEYDTTYNKEDLDVQKKLKARSKLIAGHKMTIVEVEMEDANDYEALTTLYRKIFRFLLEFAPNTKGTDRSVEREIAAALESVFPRVGLKAFIQLSYEEKTAQLLELARIILGIRLFNRDEGRGGAGIDQMDKDGNILASVLSQDIDREVEYFKDACAKYQKAVIKAHNQRRKRQYEADRLEAERKAYEEDPEHNDEPVPQATAAATAGTAGAGDKYNIFQPMEVSEFMIDRWSKELANRRQYLGFLRTLQDETRFLQEKISSICEKIGLELANVKALVSNKSSVPKEVVYPRFDALGTLWLQLYEEVVVMIARSNTFQALCKYRLSFNPTLAESYYLDQPEGGAGTEPDSAAADSKGKDSPRMLSMTADKKSSRGDSGRPQSKDSKDNTPRHMGDEHPADADGLTSVEEGLADLAEDASDKAADGADLPEVFASGAVLLSVENTPDFMMLPLELQGYCPWTIVEARGLLIPGKPVLGIVRYMNLYYVCDHAAGLRAFMTDPDSYLAQIKERAMRSPEYIHLLRLQRWFPNASIARLLKMQEMEQNNRTGQPLTRDASTGTPTHFVESYIDINYHWNEWELRKRALKIVNLKNCATVGAQTDRSHFRRENETQVYEAREHGTQTKRDKGTNPPIVTTYISGLRGKMLESEAEAKDREDAEYARLAAAADEKKGWSGEESGRSGGAESKHGGGAKDAKDHDRPSVPQRKMVHPKVGVVTLTLDL